MMVIFFKSDTDTEVIPNLIHKYYLQDTNNSEKRLLTAISKATLKI